MLDWLLTVAVGVVLSPCVRCPRARISTAATHSSSVCAAMAGATSSPRAPTALSTAPPESCRPPESEQPTSHRGERIRSQGRERGRPIDYPWGGVDSRCGGWVDPLRIHASCGLWPGNEYSSSSSHPLFFWITCEILLGRTKCGDHLVVAPQRQFIAVYTKAIDFP
jgi:hypothetical protein